MPYTDETILRLEWYKILIQGGIALAIVLLLSMKIAVRCAEWADLTIPFLPMVQKVLLEKPALTVAGIGLGYSAAIDLCYMLFTPGPDEAIQPLLVGLAGSALIVISDGTITWQDVAFVPVAVTSIGVLLFLKRRL